MPALRFQIASDMHLETPLQTPSYARFSNPTNFPIHATNLFLLGDIGLAKNPQLFIFLTDLLTTNPSLSISYVLGNHEPYGTTSELAVQKFEDYEKEVETKHGRERFYFLNRRRVDLNDEVTLLGCTLWTHITDFSALACATLLTDFNEEKGIWGRSVEEHNTDHARDLAWLNHTVTQISQEEPQREIIVLTHHSPTTDARANDPRYARSSTNDGFRTDLSDQVCWTSAQVKMWAFGHTHFNCQFYEYDAEGGKRMLIVANQKGRASLSGKAGEVEAVVVEAGEDEWKVVIGAKEGKKPDSKSGESMTHSNAHSEDVVGGLERGRGAVPVNGVPEQRE